MNPYESNDISLPALADLTLKAAAEAFRQSECCLPLVVTTVTIEVDPAGQTLANIATMIGCSSGSLSERFRRLGHQLADERSVLAVVCVASAGKVVAHREDGQRWTVDNMPTRAEIDAAPMALIVGACDHEMESYLIARLIERDETGKATLSEVPPPGWTEAYRKDIEGISPAHLVWHSYAERLPDDEWLESPGQMGARLN